MAALSTAVMWSFTGICFENAGKRVGSFSVNILRLSMAFVMMTIFNFFTRGFMLPVDASPHTWFYLSISGAFGLLIGDFFLFYSYVLIGVRVAALVMTAVPPMTAILSFLIFGERMDPVSIIGMTVTIFGISAVIFVKGGKGERLKLAHSVKGLSFAFIGAVGQSLGLIFSKMGMGSYNAFAATQIRIMAGLIGFIILFSVTNRWKMAIEATKDKAAMGFITVGSFFGPFLGVAMSLVAIQNTKAGIASTLIALVPVFVIPLTVLIRKESVNSKEIMGALIAVSGVAIMFS
jgi:drug/metabolite transporter (DMT)-like permease